MSNKLNESYYLSKILKATSPVELVTAYSNYGYYLLNKYHQLVKDTLGKKIKKDTKY